MGRFCTNCGTAFSEGALFCRNCGAKRSDSDAPATAVTTEPAQPKSPSEQIVPLVFEELKKSGPLPNYDKLTQVLEKLKKEDNNPVVEALSEIVASYKHIGKMYGLLSKPETLTSESVRANALAGLGIFPAVGGGAALAGAGAGLAAGGAGFGGNGNGGNGGTGFGNAQSGPNGNFGGRPGANGGQGYIDTTATPVRGGASNSGSGSHWGQYLGMAAAGFAGAMLADSLHSAMTSPHYTSSGFGGGTPLGFGDQQGSLDQYLQGDNGGSIFDGSIFGNGTADASGVDTTTVDQTTITETTNDPAAFDDPNGPIDPSATSYDSTTSADPLDSYVGSDTSTDTSYADSADNTSYFDNTDNSGNSDSFFGSSDSTDNSDSGFFGGSDSSDSSDSSDGGFFGGGGFFDNSDSSDDDGGFFGGGGFFDGGDDW